MKKIPRFHGITGILPITSNNCAMMGFMFLVIAVYINVQLVKQLLLQNKPNMHYLALFDSNL